MSLPQILIVLGPTATGKTALSILLAKRFKGEVVSADSRQIYKGLDLSSGKITNAEMDGVPHHLIDIAEISEDYGAARYKEDAQKAIADILSRGKLPIICGGTPFYIQVAIDNMILPEVPPNAALREELSQKSSAELASILDDLDPERADAIDRDNPRRLIRAIEIATALGKVPTLEKGVPLYTPFFIGVDRNDAVLKERIQKRIDERIAAGMIEEIQTLHANGISWEGLESLGLEPKYIARHLQGLTSKDEMTELLARDIWQFVRRQRMWFKKDVRVQWFDGDDAEGVLTAAKAFLMKAD